MIKNQFVKANFKSNCSFPFFKTAFFFFTVVLCKSFK